MRLQKRFTIPFLILDATDLQLLPKIPEEEESQKTSRIGVEQLKSYLELVSTHDGGVRKI